MMEPGVTLVTQTRVREGEAEAFSQVQASFSAVIGQQPGFIEQSVLPPHPPVQLDWVILQRFRTTADATAWLHSDARAALLARALPLLTGVDDVHLLRDTAAGALPAPVSLVITTRIKPGAETAFRAWEQRMAAAQARAPGFAGYRLEPPIPGVQDDYVAILRFENDAAMQGWMVSPDRSRLLHEAEAFTERTDARIVRAGFAQWFPAGAAAAPAWKQNMVVLLMLYPVVFLFGYWVQTPLLMQRWGMPFFAALLLANAVGVVLLSYLVPWASRLFGWWLTPGASAGRRLDVLGVVVLLALYAGLLLAFSRM